MATLGQNYTANLSAQLQSLGASGGSLGSLIDIRNTSATVSQYTFSGATSQTMTVSGGVLDLPSSETGSDQFQSSSSTVSTTLPVYSLETVPGNSYYESLSSLPQNALGFPIGRPGSSVTPVYQEEPNPTTGQLEEVLSGFSVQMPGTRRLAHRYDNHYDYHHVE